MRVRLPITLMITFAACSSNGPLPVDAAREAALDAVTPTELRREARVPDLAPPDAPRPPPHWQTLAGPAPAVRFHSATPLKDGRVLIAGGERQDAAGTTTTAECWLYDPTTHFAKTAPLATARRLHTATLLDDGRVVVTGGVSSNLAAAILFSPKQAAWSDLPSMASGRRLHSATTLGDGSVLVVGGEASPSGLTVTSAERLFDS